MHCRNKSDLLKRKLKELYQVNCLDEGRPFDARPSQSLHDTNTRDDRQHVKAAYRHLVQCIKERIREIAIQDYLSSIETVEGFPNDRQIFINGERASVLLGWQWTM